MNKINVFILKDSKEEAAVLKNVLELNSYNVVGIVGSYQEALTLYHHLSIDIIIIDIFLKGDPDGIAFIEDISMVNKRIKPFVFLTGSKNRHIYQRAKQTKPFAILHTPFNELEILYTLEKISEKIQKKSNALLGNQQDTLVSKDHLFIKKKNALCKVELASIIYIEVENRYCNIITEKEKFIILISLGKIKELLVATMFLQTHRKYIVNSNAIEQIIPKDNLLILKGNYKVTLSEKYKNILKNFNIIK